MPVAKVPDIGVVAAALDQNIIAEPAYNRIVAFIAVDPVIARVAKYHI